MKILDRFRKSVSPHTASVTGWGGFFPSFIIGVLCCLQHKPAAYAFGALFFGIVIVCLVIWFVFGQCHECGHVPRPFELYCSQCGAPLDRISSQETEGPEKISRLNEASEGGRDLTETQVSSEEIFNGLVLHLFNDTVRLPDGRQAPREVVRHVGAVCIVPVTEDRKVVVERQYRYAVGQTMIEIPAGKLDYAGEDRLEAAKRELREETGYSAERWTDMGLYYPAPAYSDEKISMYMAEGLRRGDQDLDDDEFLDLMEIPIGELVEAVVSGKIADAKTQSGILKAAHILKNRGK